VSISLPRSFKSVIYLPAMLVLALVVTGSILIVTPVQAKDYDLVILHGRVMDPESGLDAVRNVGVKDGKIAKVTEKDIKGKKTIDATGSYDGNPVKK
jgi:hypothetical protein